MDGTVLSDTFLATCPHVPIGLVNGEKSVHVVQDYFNVYKTLSVVSK